ncbi:MAG: polyprenyl synthetase family protein [Bacteroidales bacterium]|nr:polyprenyl synthetase family protein [Bacteroidales bacterium]
MDLKSIQELLKEDIQKVNDLIKVSLESHVELLSTINSYLFEEKGKQLRPLLSLTTAKACGATTPNTYICAAVVEIIHTATLLHDDVADNAPKRRGAETIQYKFSPASSVLTGDYWLAKAFFLLVEANDTQLMSFFTNAVEDLSEGELFQMQKAISLDTTEEDYINIISRKTSSLFISAIAGAAYCAGAPQRIIDEMRKYAYHLGIAFQIRDDIFDYTPEIKTGKNAGTDIKEKKITLPLICALKSCSLEEKGQMLSFIKESSSNEETLLSKTFNFVEKYSGVAHAQEILMKHSTKAIEALSCLADSKYKNELVNIALYVGTRQE